jgi:hypothetical protein
MDRITRRKYLLFLMSIVFFLGTYSYNLSLYAQEAFAIYEAETGDIEGMDISSSRGNYSGTGYVRCINNVTGSLKINANARKGGTYSLTIRYASELEDSLCYVYINSEDSIKAILKQSSVFTDLSLGDITLRPGVNEIKITYCNGEIDFDNFKFQEKRNAAPTPNGGGYTTPTPHGGDYSTTPAATPTVHPSINPPVSPLPSDEPSTTISPKPSPSPTNPVTGFKVSGYIMPDFDYSIGSAPILQSGFIVSISDTSLSALTDASGRFVINRVQYCASGYTLKIYKTGFLYREIKNVVVKGDVEISSYNNPILMWGGDVPSAGFQDNAININDIVCIANRYGTTAGHVNYVEDYDLTKDNAIGLADIMVAVKHFNTSPKSYPKLF